MLELVSTTLGAALLFAPPTGTEVEGPAPSETAEELDPAAEPELGASEEGSSAAGEGEPGEPGEPEGELGELGEPEGELGEPETSRVDEVVEAAAVAAKDRAYLERTGREIEVYVEQLDALADVSAELDGCARALQAELRMGLALAYLKRDGTCTDDSSARPDTDEELPLPVLECFELDSPRACAEELLDRVAEFAREGNAGPKAPFAQAFGCPHAVAEMSVEQMFGACMVEVYDEAVERTGGDEGEDAGPVEVWPVPRWASVTGVSAGAALVITGGVLVGIDGNCPGGYDPVTEPDLCPSVYNTNAGGGALLSIGAVAMVGMGVVLAVTEIQRSRQDDRRESAFLRRLHRAEALTGLRLSPPRIQLRRRP